MESMPARGPQRTNGALLLNRARDLESFQAGLVRLCHATLREAEVVIGLLDESSKTLALPSWLKAHLKRHPALGKKLLQGEMVGISHSETSTLLRPVSAARSNVLLIPVFDESRPLFLIGVISSMEASQPSQEDLETVRDLGHDAAPILARLCEIEDLRRKNAELAETGRNAEQLQLELARVTRQKEILEVILKMRTHLQSNAAHELRTPLAAIRGYARMILDGRAGEINNTQRGYLLVVNDNTNRLINLVNWMGHVLELGTQYLNLTSFDLRTLWVECLKKNEPLIAEKSIQLHEQFADEPFTLIADREKLAVVLNAFLSTAAKLTTEAGHISAEFSRGRDKDFTVKFSIVGTIADTTEVAPAEVYDIVGLHGGRVFVNVRAGEDSTLLFTLPAVAHDGEERPTHEQTINPSRRRRQEYS